MELEYFNIVFAFVIVMLIFSLVITILVQIVVAASGLRGRNLIWGVTKVLERSPTLQAYAGEIARTALRHPAITPTGKTATVIGSNELLAVLNDLVEPSNSSLKNEAKEALNKVLKSAVSQDSQYQAEKLASEFKGLFPNEATKMDEALKLLQQKTSRLFSGFDAWFDTIMSRSTDRFIARTRVWTVVFAVLLAFGLQSDSFDLLKNLSTDSELRAGLIQKADQTFVSAQEVLLAKPVAVEALEMIRPEFAELADKPIPSSLVTRGQGEAWLVEEFSKKPNLAKIRTAYKKKFDELTPKRLEKLGNQVAGLKDDLEASRLIVIPENRQDYVERWTSIRGHLPGLVLSIILLSLGAPFWFNALRSLASLSPILAGKADPSETENK